MQLHEIQPRLFDYVVDVVGIFVDEDTHDVGPRLSFGWIGISLAGCEQRTHLLRLYIAMARFVKDETEHVRARLDCGVDMLSGAQPAYFYLCAVVCAFDEVAHPGWPVLRDHQRFADQHPLYIVACQPARIGCRVYAALCYHYAVRRDMLAHIAYKVWVHLEGD